MSSPIIHAEPRRAAYPTCPATPADLPPAVATLRRLPTRDLKAMIGTSADTPALRRELAVRRRRSRRADR